MAVGESVSNGTLWDTRRSPRGNTALPSMSALFCGPHSTPLLVGTQLSAQNKNLEHKESSITGDSIKGSCSEAPHGADGQNPVQQGAGEAPLIGEKHLSPSSLSFENPESLTEKVSTLGLQGTRKNHCGAANKRARKARLAETPTGDSGSSQPRSSRGGRPQILQKSGTSGAHGKTKERTEHGCRLSLAGLESQESKGHPDLLQKPHVEAADSKTPAVSLDEERLAAGISTIGLQTKKPSGAQLRKLTR